MVDRRKGLNIMNQVIDHVDGKLVISIKHKKEWLELWEKVLKDIPHREWGRDAFSIYLRDINSRRILTFLFGIEYFGDILRIQIWNRYDGDLLIRWESP